MKILDHKKRTAIEECYSDINQGQILNKSGGIYNYYYLSRFNKKLDDSAAGRLVLNFPEEIVSTKRLQQYYLEEKKFLDFYGHIFHKYNCFEVVFEQDKIKHPEYDIYEFESEAEYLDYCKDSLREKTFINILVPDLKLILLGDFDLMVYCVIDKTTPIVNLRSIAAKFKLHLVLD